MNIVAAFEQVGTYRGAAALCGNTHKTVRRVIEAQQAGRSLERRRHRHVAKNTDVARDVIAEKVRATDGCRCTTGCVAPRTTRRVARCTGWRVGRLRRVHQLIGGEGHPPA